MKDSDVVVVPAVVPVVEPAAEPAAEPSFAVDKPIAAAELLSSSFPLVAVVTVAIICV